jgi:hypothetical protein
MSNLDFVHLAVFLHLPGQLFQHLAAQHLRVIVHLLEYHELDQVPGTYLLLPVLQPFITIQNLHFTKICLANPYYYYADRQGGHQEYLVDSVLDVVDHAVC